MGQRDLGRDTGLAVRMAVALAGIAALYVLVAAVLVALLVEGILIALWFLFMLGAAFIGHLRKADALALRAVGARVVSSADRPELHASVARLAAHADLPAPRVALVDSAAANAFAVGTSPRRAVVVVTTGLLATLRDAELEAVIAHEVAHIANRDGIVMTLVGAPATAGEAFRGAKRDPRSWPFFLVYLPVYVVGLLVMLAISRYREFAADRGAALLTGAPEQLMSALQTLAGAPARGDLRGGFALSALCIVPTRRRRLRLLSDHPPLHRRLDELAALARAVVQTA